MLSNPPAEQKVTEQVPASAAGPCHRAALSPLYQEQLAIGCRETSREETESGDKTQASDFEKGLKEVHLENEGALRQMTFDPKSSNFEVNPGSTRMHMCNQQGNVEYICGQICNFHPRFGFTKANHISPC